MYHETFVIQNFKKFECKRIFLLFVDFFSVGRCKDSCLVLSQRIFPKWQLPKDIFPKGSFHKCAISQAATSQVCPSRSTRPPAHPSRSARPHCSLQHLRGPNLTFGKLPLGKLHPWEVATWENALGKVPNTVFRVFFLVI